MKESKSRWAQAAVEHVTGSSRGSSLDRRLRVTLNFHPDRLLNGQTVIRHLAHDQAYRSQFETGTSNGGLTAYAGGDRWHWEQRIFGGAYDDAPAEERPKYGALNHRRRSVGGALRFESCHLRLAEHLLDRSTFCFPDSVSKPTDFGTATRFDLVALAEAQDHDELDDYIEAHVHGKVRLPPDVEAIVLDPCFRGTDVEADAHQAHHRVEWSEGRVLSVAELERHPDFRGPEIVAIGRAVAQGRPLTARVIGAASRKEDHDPQDLKLLWHCIARFGSPA